MALTTVPVTGFLPLPNGVVFDSATVEFKLDRPDFDTVDDASIGTASIFYDVDGSGEIAADLWSNSRGVKGSAYTVRLYYQQEGATKASLIDFGSMQVSATGGDIADFLAVGVIAGSIIVSTLTQAEYDEIITLATDLGDISDAVAATEADAEQTALDRIATGEDVVAAESARDSAVSARDLAETYAGVDHRAATWTALAAISGTAGDLGYVGPEDTGTHADPVAGGTVPNEGVYTWAANGLGSAQAERTASTGLAGLQTQLDGKIDITAREADPWGYAGVLDEAANVLDSREWVFSNPLDISSDRVVTEISLHSKAAGRIAVSSWVKTGSSFTKQNSVSVDVVEGEQTVYLKEGLSVAAGHLVGFYNTAGTITFGTGAAGTIPDWGTYYSNGGGEADTFSDATASGIVSFRIRFGHVASLDDVDKLAIAEGKRANARLDNLGADDWRETKQFILVWVVGQSNGAGRGTSLSEYTIEAGRGYKWDDAGNALADLADPTGNDTQAVTNGYSSFGPALGYSVLDQSSGAVGVIIVNSCVGGTSIGGNWGDGDATWNAAKVMFDDAVAAINTAGHDIIGCVGAISLGEQDASLGTTEAAFEAGLLDLWSRMQTHTGMGGRFSLLMAQTGQLTTGDTAAYQAIRKAQADVARDNSGVVMAHSRAKKFPDDGLMEDTVHYSTAGLDEIGWALGFAAPVGIGSRPDGLTD